LIKTLQIIQKRQFLIGLLVRQQLILRYRRTFFGYLWTLINPLLTMGASTIIFGTLFKADIKTFGLYLFAGFIPWNCFNNLLIQTSNSLLANEALMKKIAVPKIIFPVAISISVLIDSILSFITLLILMVLIEPIFSWSLIFIPAAFLMIYLFSLGIALILSILTVYFRDLQYVITILLQIIFFFTPVIYRLDTLGEGLLPKLISFNPLSVYLEIMRLPIVDHVIPSLPLILTALLLSISSFTFGLFVFNKYEKVLIYRL
jgi:ABC-2 type transport system permease protein/lipopolysaccharide transport system permease protein